MSGSSEFSGRGVALLLATIVGEIGGDVSGSSEFSGVGVYCALLSGAFGRLPELGDSGSSICCKKPSTSSLHT